MGTAGAFLTGWKFFLRPGRRCSLNGLQTGGKPGVLRLRLHQSLPGAVGNLGGGHDIRLFGDSPHPIGPGIFGHHLYGGPASEAAQ